MIFISMNKSLKVIALILVFLLIIEIIFVYKNFFNPNSSKSNTLTLKAEESVEKGPETLINRAKDYVNSRITNVYLLIEIEGKVKKLNYHDNQYGQYYHLVISDKDNTSEMALSLFKDQLSLTKIYLQSNDEKIKSSINDLEIGDQVLITSKEDVETSKRLINEIIITR